jgi:hypothetical protein
VWLSNYDQLRCERKGERESGRRGMLRPSRISLRTTASLLASSCACKNECNPSSLSEGTKFADLVLMPMYFFRVAASKRAILGHRSMAASAFLTPRGHSRSTSIRVPSLEPAGDCMPALA